MKSPSTASPFGPSLQQVLVTRHGVVKEEVRWHILTRILPWRARLWRSLRLLLGGDPFDADFGFGHDVAAARSLEEVERAVLAYESRLGRVRRFTGAVLGTTPNRRRVLAFWHRTWEPLAGPPAVAAADATHRPVA